MDSRGPARCVQIDDPMVGFLARIDDVGSPVSIHVDRHAPDVGGVAFRCCIGEAALGHGLGRNGAAREGRVRNRHECLGADTECRGAVGSRPSLRDPKLSVLLEEEIGSAVSGQVGQCLPHSVALTGLGDADG